MMSAPDKVAADYDAMLNRAETERETGNRGEAMHLYKAAHGLLPNRVYPLYWLATFCKEEGKLEEAYEYGRRGIEIDPDQIGLLLRMGEIASAMLDPLAALEYYSRVRTLDPEAPNIDGLLADQHFRLSHVDEGIAAFERALARDPDSKQLHTARLFCLNLTEAVSPEVLAEEHRRWGQRTEERIVMLPARPAQARPPRLRIGFVSPDLRDHAVAHFTAPLFEHRNTSQYEHVVFDTSSRAEDSITALLRATGVAWHRVAKLGDDDLAALVRANAIDVLVDLAGHTAGNRLEVFARKPAPVQATWLGYLCTTGLSRMDFRITDAHMDPPGMTEALHSERLVRLPAQACFSALAGASTPSRGSPAGDGGITYGSVNQWAKVSSAARHAWGEILRRNPRSRLVVIARGGQNPKLKAMIVAEFVARGADAAQIEVVPFLSTPEFLALLARIDIALDPFPYGGGTTTFQCLWMGIPVVSLTGRTALSRNSVGPLAGVGLADLLAATPKEYVDIACRLGADLPRLRQLHATLRRRMQSSLIMDGKAFARAFECACDSMWEQSRLRDRQTVN